MLVFHLALQRNKVKEVGSTQKDQVVLDHEHLPTYNCVDLSQSFHYQIEDLTCEKS